uniref:RING-type E3 ubiquitin transferase n=1 Tax=Schizochytrium sp. TaxID=1907177 RepID=A0AA49K3Z5_9STRA|nr:PEX10 [Schizochytrium sp.]
MASPMQQQLLPEAPWPPTFERAGQPDMVLAAQKDAYYRQKVREKFLGGFDVILQPYQSVAVMPEVKLLAELAYFALTTGRGRQTLGEEYCDVLPVVVQKQGGRREAWAAPGKLHKLALLFFGVIAPYLVKRIESGGWKSLAVLFQKPLTAAERAAEMRRRMLERARQQTQQSQSSSASRSGTKIDVDAPAESPLVTLKKKLVDFWTEHRESLLWVLGWSGIFSKVHLAVFYLRGTYYEWSKRLAGYQHIFTRAPKSDRPSYRVLGWFLLAQLAIGAAPAIRGAIRSVLFAWGFLATKNGKKLRSSKKSKKGKSQRAKDFGATSVPSSDGKRGITSNDQSSGSDNDEDDDDFDNADEKYDDDDADEESSVLDADEIVPSLPTADAASQDLEDLDLVVLRDKNHERGMEHIKCGICLSPVENGACPPCGHMYCYEHISEAIAVKSECPLCRQACEPSDIMCVYFTL